MTFDDSPEMRNDPPPTYKSSYDFGAEERIAVINSSSLGQLTQNLVDTLGSILDVSFGKEQLIESLETTLRQQPVAKHKQIFDIAQSIVHACHNVYGPKEDSSTIKHGEKHRRIKEEDFDASQTESDTEDAASEIYPQRRQSMSAKDQLELQESAQGLKLSQANSSKKVLRSKATSSNTKPLPTLQGRNAKRASTPFAMSQKTCDTASRESSRLSSPEIMDTPPRIEDALQKETPKDPKDPDYALHSLIDQSTQDFIYHSHQQIIEFSSCEDSSPTYTVLVRSLYGKESEGESTWSMGSQWLHLAEGAQTDRKYGAILCALAAMEFQKWHESQKLQHKDLPSQTASKRVTDRLVGSKPADHYEKRTWIQRRSNIATLLTRGKKWIQLVEHLGLGILFKDAW
ncbi:hypothetical protein TRIATDRAFT_304764 [Trichoderma atroviride IMI 206040]|uniref:Uncharacterized protein n=1 Tax=Hypocrea atroviridis (strain ATCC 20476 / IMI 206040) TaxID=452589 RepID=G9NJ10_HYPAI|nr:uncharacterized protein TRIATDRAFT_304764 [Trichoderma atroviride IMI 206040]EHK48887.1 hypothetical protein TRIATDRAFT_304764 [Trichoderma atroviride IMI 206040]